VGKRICEVSVEAEGRRYSATVEADSAFHAAVLFYAHCAAPPPGCNPPKIDLEAVVEVKPALKVKLRDAMAWANEKARSRNRL